MKIATGTLLLIFSVLFSSIELSLQSNNNRESGSTSPSPEDVRTITLPNLPLDYAYELPNGNYYVSRGTGPITILYNRATGIAMVGQPGHHPVYIGPPNTRRTRARTSSLPPNSK